MKPARVAALLAFMLGIQPVTTDLYLPALPTLQGDLHASLAGAQMTLSATVIAFGFAQLLCGPLSDRLGRRPVLLAGMLLYTLAAIGGSLATRIEPLIAWRGLQGAAMAAGVTCGRSIVRDLYTPQEGARVMSGALGSLGVIAMVSPVLGGVLVQFLGWRAALLAPAVFGATALAFIFWRFEETVRTRQPRALELATLLRNWSEVVRNPTFRAWAALLSLSYGGIFFILAGGSFVFIQRHGVSRLTFGLLLAANSLAYVIGTLLCRRLLTRHGLAGTARRGAVLALVGGLGMAGLSLAGVDSVWAIVLPSCVFAVSHGVNQPCGQAGAVSPFPEKAGTAASLSGFAMMLTAFGIGLWLGHGLKRPDADAIYPLTLGVGAFSAALAAVAWTAVHRHGDRHAGTRAAVQPV